MRVSPDNPAEYEATGQVESRLGLVITIGDDDLVLDLGDRQVHVDLDGHANLVGYQQPAKHIAGWSARGLLGTAQPTALRCGRLCHTWAMSTLQDFSATSIDGQDVDLSSYSGQVVLVVNTASQCGFTPQYAGLQELQDTYGERGFNVLGFPCDQFGNQEPGEEADIAEFCERSFGVGFPMFAKIDVNGDGAHPLFRWLREEKGGLVGDKIKWNFTKFLVGRDGRVIKRYAPTTKPEKITGDIEKALAP